MISVYVNISAHMGRVQYIQVSLNKRIITGALLAHACLCAWHGAKPNCLVLVLSTDPRWKAPAQACPSLPANPKFKGWHGLTNNTRRYSHQITSNQQIHANSQWFHSKCVIIRHYHPPKKRTNILNSSICLNISNMCIYIYSFIILNRKKCDT